MQIRMVQIGETFNKFRTTVMDIPKKPEIEPVICAAETEFVSRRFIEDKPNSSGAYNKKRARPRHRIARR